MRGAVLGVILGLALGAGATAVAADQPTPEPTKRVCEVQPDAQRIARRMVRKVAAFNEAVRGRVVRTDLPPSQTVDFQVDQWIAAIEHAADRMRCSLGIVRTGDDGSYQPTRGDAVNDWMAAQRGQYPPGPEREAIDRMLAEYLWLAEGNGAIYDN